jgi:hypothetical protein
MHTKIFEQLQKVKIICKTAMVCKKLKMHAVSMTPACTVHAVSMTAHAKYRMHDRRTIRMAMTAFKGNIYQKHIYVPELSYPTTKKMYKFKGATKQKFSCMRFQ